MNATDVKQCLYLLAATWTSYKPPQDKLFMDVTIRAWSNTFEDLEAEKTVELSELEAAIASLAKEKHDFAPQVGEIYNRVKDMRDQRRAALKAAEPPGYRELLGIYAGVVDVDPPDAELDIKTLKAWFRETREKQLNSSL